MDIRLDKTNKLIDIDLRDDAGIVALDIDEIAELVNDLLAKVKELEDD